MTVGKSGNTQPSGTTDGIEERACPRCGSTMPGRPACPRCGLRVEFRERYAASLELPESLAPLWDAVAAKWETPGLHELFLQACHNEQKLDLAAARYRALREDPVRGAQAQAAIERIVALAETALAQSAFPRSRVTRNRRIALAIGFCVSVGLAFWLVRLVLTA